MKLAITFLAAALPVMAGADDTFLMRGITVHPVSGPDVPNANLLVKDGKIAEIGKVTAPKGTKIIEGKGLHVYPGMIDSGTNVGMSEVGSVRETADTTEIGEFKPQLRAGIAVNPSSEHIAVTRANGITSYIALPEGGTIAGQASLMHLDGWTWEEMQIRMGAAMHMILPTLGPAGGGRGGGGGGFAAARVPFAEMRRTYDRRMRELSDYLEWARRYQKAKAAGGPGFKTDLHLEAMLPVLDKKMPVVITAMRERAIKDAIAFADKEKVRIVVSGVREPGGTAPELKKRDIAVILGPTLALPLEEDDPYDDVFALPGQLHKAGVKIAFASFGSQFARDLPYQAAAAVGFGLPQEEALKSVTLNPAQIWGVGDQIGSIETGKWADLMVTDGDPLEASTNVKQVFIKGKEVDIESRHTKLYKKYLARP